MSRAVTPRATAIPEAFLAALLSFLAGGGQQLYIVFLFNALFGFEDEAAAFVEVDAAEGVGTIGVDEDDAALEDVGIVIIFGVRGFRMWDF